MSLFLYYSSDNLLTYNTTFLANSHSEFTFLMKYFLSTPNCCSFLYPVILTVNTFDYIYKCFFIIIIILPKPLLYFIISLNQFYQNQTYFLSIQVQWYGCFMYRRSFLTNGSGPCLYNIIAIRHIFWSKLSSFDSCLTFYSL